MSGSTTSSIGSSEPLVTYCGIWSGIISSTSGPFLPENAAASFSSRFAHGCISIFRSMPELAASKSVSTFFQ